MKTLAVLSLFLLGATFPKFDFSLNDEFVGINYESSTLNVKTEKISDNQYRIRFIQQGWQTRVVETTYILKRGIVVQYEKKARLLDA
jgi:hypothetical protein